MANSDDQQHPAVLLRSVLTTTKRAGAFLDLLVDRLGDRAVSIVSGEGRSRQVYVSDAGGVVPWPIASLAIADPALLDAQEAQADAEREEPWKAPPAPGEARFFQPVCNPVAGNLIVAVGGTQLGVHYGRDGRWTDSSGSPDAALFASIQVALDAGTDSRLELLAAWVAGLGVGPQGPARVVLPRPTAGDPPSVWAVGRDAIRRALVRGRAPAAASWAVADGVAGTAIAFGATRDEALASWREVVERVRPTPPPPRVRPEPGTTFDPTSWAPEGEGSRAEFGGRAEGAEGAEGAEAPAFDGSPEAIPAAVVRLEAVKPDAAAGAWERFLGERGATAHALRIPRGRGYQLVGEALAGKVELASLDGERRRARTDVLGPEMRQALAAQFGFEPTTLVLWFQCVDAATGLPCPPTVHRTARGPAFDAATLDGDVLRHSIVEVSPIE